MNAILRRHVRLSVNRDGVVARRDVLKMLAAGGTAATTLNWRDGLSLQAAELRREHKACILLWMQGGPSQFETFDPKPEHANGGETKTIDTNVPGIKLADNLPHLAKVADKLAIIRSMTSREGDHQRATHLMHTSYLPLASVQFPSVGAATAHELADAASELPAFVRVGNPIPVAGSGGFLGSRFDAFNVQAAGRVPDNAQAATEEDRFRRRVDLIGRLREASAVGPVSRSSDHQKLYENASRMVLSPEMKAFDLNSESAAVKEAYGTQIVAEAGPRGGGGRAGGQGFAAACLLARRLVESGVTFVELNIGGWDTHQDNFTACRGLTKQLDQPFAYLLTDLEQRGLLDRTLVVWMGEFGRTPRINPRTGRDHFPRAFSAVMAGCGIRGGQVIGSTDAAGETVADNPVTEKDLFQSIYKSLGVNAKKEHMSPIGRPIKFVDGGVAVEQLFG